MGPSFRSFSIITEHLANHEEIDCDDVCEQGECASGTMDSHLARLRPLLALGPLKGYSYTPFKPQDKLRTRTGHIHTSPTQHDATVALRDLGQSSIQSRTLGLDIRTQIWIFGDEHS